MQSVVCRASNALSPSSWRWNLLLVLLVLCLSNGLALAQTDDNWIGGTGYWSVDGNWSTGQPPLYNQNCIFPGSSTVTDDTAGTCNNFSLAAGDNLAITPGYLQIYGTSMMNSGTINIGTGNGLEIAGSNGNTVTLSGGGTVTMSNAESVIGWAQTGTTALVNADNTIQGEGTIGDGTIGLTNQSSIIASGGTLTVQPNSTGMTNTGAIQASSGSTLECIGTFNNAGGTIQALSGGTVILDGSFAGGTLSTSGNGVMQVVAGNGTTLNGLTNAGNYQILSSASTTLRGTINNTGKISLLSTGGGTDLYISGTVTLTGKGSVVTSNNADNYISSATGNDTLINQQTIQGEGTIGGTGLALTNQGTVEATSTSNPLVLESATTNTATLEASGGGTLEIQTAVDNTGATILAAKSSTVLLYSGTISGGTLKTSSSGSFQTISGTLDGMVNVPTNAGLFTVANDSTLNLEGTINNTGTIALDTTGGCLVLVQPTTLTGSGTVTMTANNCIYGSGNAFTNQSTIQGAGTIGDSNPMPITNAGTILANQASPLDIVPDSNGFTNKGTLVANSGSTLDIVGLFNNFSGTTLTGGNYALTGTLEFQNANIVTNAASITLTGASAQILDSNTNNNALANLAATVANSLLSLQGGQILTTAASYANKGKTTVGAGSGFTVAKTYSQSAGTTTVDGTLTAKKGLIVKKGTLLGQGTVAAVVTSNAAITVGDSTSKPGVLSSTGTYTQSGTGILNVSIGGKQVGSQYSQLAVSNGSDLNGTLNIKLINGYVPSIGDEFTILTSSALTGQFATVKGGNINSSEHFQVNYGSTSVTLQVVSGEAEK